MSGNEITLLAVAVCLTTLIHAIETLQYGVSFAGIRRRRLATAGSLFGVVLLLSRTANTIQGVLLGSFADKAASGEAALSGFLLQLRWVLLAATLGSLAGAVLLPTFIRYLGKAIEVFVRHGSYPGIVGALLARRGIGREDLVRAKKAFAPPTKARLRTIPWKDQPVGFLLVDILVTAIFAVGVLAPLYAGVLAPDRSMTAVNLSGVINGIATALLFLVISPKVASFVDEALADEEKILALRAMVILLALGKIFGTLLAQALLVPSARLIAWIASLL